MRRIIKTIIALSVVSIIILNINFIISVIGLSIFNKKNYDDSLMKKENIEIEIGGGYETKEKDWYPLVNCYNAYYFDKYVNKDVELTILYNFGYFNKNTSVIFNPNSDFYSSFYGCYIVKSGGDKYYGFDAESIVNVDEIVKIPEYDYKVLVAGDMGCPNDKMIMDYEIINIVEDVELSGKSDFIRIDTDVIMNGLNHQYKEFKRNYIQYGIPRYNDMYEEFELVKMKGRLYISTLKDDLTIIYYIFSPNADIVNKCDEEIIKNAKLKI